MRTGVYGQILRKRQAQVLVGSSVIAGLSVGIPLAIVLMVEGETGSFADAGAVTAALALAGAVTSPFRGRLVDKHGQSRVLPTFAVLSALGLTGLVVATLAGAPLWVLIAFAVGAGAATAPFLSALRPLWAELVDHPDQLVGAYALQAILIEIFFIGGPLAAAGLIALGSPAAAVLALAGAELLGILAFAATPVSRGWRGEPRTVGRAGALASPGMRTLIAVDVPVGIMFGVLDVAVPAFAGARDAEAAAGAVLAALAVGSMIGGIVYGARSRTITPTRWARLLGLLTLLVLPLAAADSVAVLAVLMAIAGLAVAPSTTVGIGLIDDVAPAGTATEAMSWTGTAYSTGLAIGTATAGSVIDRSGTTAAFLGAAACVALATMIATVRRRTLVATADS